VLPKDTADLGALCTGFPVTAAVYISGTGRSMQERIKEHGRNQQPARTKTSTFSEHVNKPSKRALEQSKVY